MNFIAGQSSERAAARSLTGEAGCPAPLLSLVERCWVDVPTERPSVEEFIEVLRGHELEAVADAEQRKVSSCHGETVCSLFLGQCCNAAVSVCSLVQAPH